MVGEGESAHVGTHRIAHTAPVGRHRSGGGEVDPDHLFRGRRQRVGEAGSGRLVEEVGLEGAVDRFGGHPSSEQVEVKGIAVAPPCRRILRRRGDEPGQVLVPESCRRAIANLLPIVNLGRWRSRVRWTRAKLLVRGGHTRFSLCAEARSSMTSVDA